MTITNNITPNTHHLLINNPQLQQIHTINIVDGNTGEILEEFNYNCGKWFPFESIFEKYQKQHIKFDVIEDGIQSTRLFRKYQKTNKGTWIKKCY